MRLLVCLGRQKRLGADDDKGEKAKYKNKIKEERNKNNTENNT